MYPEGSLRGDNLKHDFSAATVKTSKFMMQNGCVGLDEVVKKAKARGVRAGPGSVLPVSD